MGEIYLGRIVVVGRTKTGNLAALYRVSSRSFPNRQAVLDESKQSVRIVPKPGHEADVMRNPYIAYNCARVVRDTAVVTNGSQTDPIAEKIASGMSPRDALVYSLCVMDYEKDDYNTPRIAAVVERGGAEGWLGCVRHDGLAVEAFSLEPGRCVYVATYEHNVPDRGRTSDFDAADAQAGCAFVLGEGVFAEFLHPVSAVCLLAGPAGFTMAAQDATS